MDADVLSMMLKAKGMLTLALVVAQSATGATFITFDNWNGYEDNDYVNNFVFHPSGPYGGQHQMVTAGGKTGGALSLGYYSGTSYLKAPMSNALGRVHQASVFFKRPIGGIIHETLVGLYLSKATNSLTNGFLFVGVQSEPTNNGASGRLWLQGPTDTVEVGSGEGFGEWFRLSLSVWVEDASGVVLASGTLERWGTNGATFGRVVSSFASEILNTDLAQAPNLYFGFWGAQVNDSYLDDFAADTFDAVQGNLRGPIALRVSEVEISWPARLDRVYEVQYRSDVSSNAWVSAGPPVHAVNPRASFSDKVPMDAPKRFYRVVELP